MRRFRDVTVGRARSSALLRLLFALLFGATGFLLGREAYLHVFSLHLASSTLQFVCLVLAPVLGALLGVLLAPLAQGFFVDEVDAAERAIERLAPAQLVGGAAGLIAGLVVAVLVRAVIFEFISGGGRAATYIAILLYVLFSVFAAFLGARIGARLPVMHLGGAGGEPKVIDTSVIVDGRFVEIVESGFLEGPFILPRFILRELQAIADSSDSLKRTRGRRGLDVLTRLQELGVMEISERDYDDLQEADAKLVRLAQDHGAKLLTTDYNLNRVAHVEGVGVLNVNELANALKPVVVPGEDLRIQVIRDGKELHQGVGYLDDGTMVVVENGRRLIGETVDVVVTSVLQTVAGRMIFARPKSARAVTGATGHE